MPLASGSLTNTTYGDVYPSARVVWVGLPFGKIFFPSASKTSALGLQVYANNSRFIKARLYRGAQSR